MYVLKADVATKTAGLFYPAEACLFKTQETTDNTAYEVVNAVYINPADGTELAMTNVKLGYISKTGRFTSITK